jgi:phosphoribosylformylglycinamidine synthase
VEDTGGVIDIDRLPLGDPGLSFKEILGNESQERMGLVISPGDKKLLEEVSLRERAPFYIVGKVTGDKHFKAFSSASGETPVDMSLMHLFGNTPVLKISGKTQPTVYPEFNYDSARWEEYLEQVLRLEAVASKDWLTHKVDRCVTGRIAKQQTCGTLQLPLNNVGVVALDYRGKDGIATSIGHAPAAGLINAAAGSRLAVAEALTNLVWAPIYEGLKSVSLSANWMWPAGTERENARLYEAVKALSDFVLELGINVPTGKDSLSMTQRYQDTEVSAPGTVIVSAAAHCDAIDAVVEPVLLSQENSQLYFLDMSASPRHLGGSSLSQIFRSVGISAPDVLDSGLLVRTFETLQLMIKNNQVLAGHDVGSGGLITTLLEMCFPSTGIGMDIDLGGFEEDDLVKILFAENPGVVIQAVPGIEEILEENQLRFYKLGKPKPGKTLNIRHNGREYYLDIEKYRKIWFETSYLLDSHQSGEEMARQRYDNLTKSPLQFNFPGSFTGNKPVLSTKKTSPIAGVLREQGSNSEREMAYALHIAGFEVRDIHMSDIITGKENLDDVDFLVAVGGFSNSDVLGSAKGWAGSFLYNKSAKNALDNFYKREDTLSLGVCNGCQLFVELGLLTPDHKDKPRMMHNDSGKFECIFTSVDIQPNHTVMLSSLSGSRLGIWAAHGEGKFSFPYEESHYHIPGKYTYDTYPANPNGSQYNAAMLASSDGRHLAMMPHLERSIFPWNWAYYPNDRKDDVISPWIEAFQNAYNWLVQHKYS